MFNHDHQSITVICICVSCIKTSHGYAPPEKTISGPRCVLQLQACVKFSLHIKGTGESCLATHKKENNTHETCQSAYRSGLSTETAPRRVQNDIFRAIDSRKCVFLVHSAAQLISCICI